MNLCSHQVDNEVSGGFALSRELRYLRNATSSSSIGGWRLRAKEHRFRILASSIRQASTSCADARGLETRITQRALTIMWRARSKRMCSQRLIHKARGLFEPINDLPSDRIDAALHMPVMLDMYVSCRKYERYFRPRSYLHKAYRTTSKFPDVTDHAPKTITTLL